MVLILDKFGFPFTLISYPSKPSIGEGLPIAGYKIFGAIASSNLSNFNFPKFSKKASILFSSGQISIRVEAV